MSDWFSGDVLANGIKIHIYRTGGDKPPLVLCHGFSDNGLCWVRAARALEKDYDVIMPDARGHGFSDAPVEGYTSEDMAADLAGLIQALGLERPGLVGHSMGADTVAVTAASFPHLAGCAILEDPPWFDRDSPRFRERFGLSKEEQEARVQAQRASIVERKRQTREELMALCRENSPAWDEAEVGPWADSKLQLSPHVAARMGAPRAHWSEIASRIACPALLVTADMEAGAIVTPQVAQEVAAANPHIRVVHIGGAGHSIRREQFELFMQAVAAFLVSRCKRDLPGVTLQA